MSRLEPLGLAKLSMARLTAEQTVSISTKDPGVRYVSKRADKHQQMLVGIRRLPLPWALRILQLTQSTNTHWALAAWAESRC